MPYFQAVFHADCRRHMKDEILHFVQNDTSWGCISKAKAVSF